MKDYPCWIVVDQAQEPVLETVVLSEADAWKYMIDEFSGSKDIWRKGGFTAIKINLVETK